MTQAAMDSTMVAVTPTITPSDIERAEKFRRGIGGSYDRDVDRLAAEFARHRTQSEGRTEAAEEIASLRARVEGLVAENESLRHECTSMWRGGVSNTVAVVDRVRNAFAKGLRLKKNARLAHFDAELDIALGDWFDLTRIAKPGTYNESENVFRQARQALKDTPDAE